MDDSLFAYLVGFLLIVAFSLTFISIIEQPTPLCSTPLCIDFVARYIGCEQPRNAIYMLLRMVPEGLRSFEFPDAMFVPKPSVS